MNQNPRIIQDMLQESFYPHAVEKTVLLQTHISFVILTGEFAYKIKKPVKFSFLDFSSLELRKKYISLELELNRKYAPDLYLEIVPVYFNNGYTLEKSGEIREYCLKMRQFPQANILGRMFADGKLDRDLLREAGILVAKLHQRNLPAPEEFQDLQYTMQTAEENLADAAALPNCIAANDLQQIRLWTEAVFENDKQLFLERIRENKICDCHGDLHLNNICFYRNKVTVFDCIEFNPRFRFIDTIYDLAFLFMDLLYRDRKDLAYLLLNSYLLETGDYTGAGLLKFYTLNRAMIRGKVYGFMARDSQLQEKKQLQSNSRKFYNLALSLANYTAGTVTIFCGMSGSGKSTVAGFVAEKKGAVHLRSDAIRKNLAGLPLYERGSQGIYSPEMSRLTYEKMESTGVFLAKRGIDVILDARYSKKKYRDHIRKVCLQNQLQIRFVYCSASEAILKNRLQQRTNDVSDAGPGLLEMQKAEEEQPSREEGIFILDTSAQWQDIVLRHFHLD